LRVKSPWAYSRQGGGNGLRVLRITLQSFNPAGRPCRAVAVKRLRRPFPSFRPLRGASAVATKAMGFQGLDAANRRAAPGWRRRSLGSLRPDPRTAVKPRQRRGARARSGLTASPDQAAGAVSEYLGKAGSKPKPTTTRRRSGGARGRREGTHGLPGTLVLSRLRQQASRRTLKNCRSSRRSRCVADAALLTMRGLWGLSSPAKARWGSGAPRRVRQCLAKHPRSSRAAIHWRPQAADLARRR
jgi:hypothetical protein